MNILMINYEYPPLGGGGGVFNRQLAETLSKTNNVTVITSEFRDEPSREIRNDVEIIRVPIFFRDDKNAATIPSMLSFFPASLWRGYKLLKNRSFDIIHSFFAIPSAPSGLVLGKRFKIPHVLSILGGDIYDPSKKLSPHKTPILHETVKKIIRQSDCVVSLSADIKTRAFNYYHLSRDIDVIHLGIPKPHFEKRSRTHFNFTSDDILLITVGRLVPRKANEELIEVLHRLEKPKVKLLVIGDGPEKSRLAALANSFNVADRVHFFGYVGDEEKFQLLDISDIYVSSSHHEGFGIVFLEAMICGLPIVCYDKGGQTDFLVDQKTGYLVSHGDTNLLTQRLQQLCRDAELRRRISEFNGHYITNFYISHCAHRYQSLYESIINKMHYNIPYKHF